MYKRQVITDRHVILLYESRTHCLPLNIIAPLLSDFNLNLRISISSLDWCFDCFFILNARSHTVYFECFFTTVESMRLTIVLCNLFSPLNIVLSVESKSYLCLFRILFPLIILALYLTLLWILLWKFHHPAFQSRIINTFQNLSFDFVKMMFFLILR